MPTSIPLPDHTHDGNERVARLPAVDDETADRFRAIDADPMEGSHGRMEEYGGFGLMEGPDEETGETTRLAFERDGAHHARTTEASR